MWCWCCCLGRGRSSSMQPGGCVPLGRSGMVRACDSKGTQQHKVMARLCLRLGHLVVAFALRRRTPSGRGHACVRTRKLTYASPPFAPNTGPTGSVEVFLPSSGGPGSPVVAGPPVASSVGVAWSSITDRGMVRRVSSPQPSTRGRRLLSGSSSVVFSSFPWRTLVPALVLLLLQRGATSMPLWSDPFASDRLC